jgi:hypothetical protein
VRREKGKVYAMDELTAYKQAQGTLRQVRNALEALEQNVTPQQWQAIRQREQLVNNCLAVLGNLMQMATPPLATDK